MTRYVIPKSIISSKPTIYQCDSHIQYLIGESAASTAFVHCNAIFATKAFNFYCVHIIYITTKVITNVINAAMKRSMSTMKLSRNDPSFKPIWAFFLILFVCYLFSVFILCYNIFHSLWGRE